MHDVTRWITNFRTAEAVVVYIWRGGWSSSGVAHHSWRGNRFEVQPLWLVLLCMMSMLSWSLREQDIGPNIPLSFTSIVLVASVALVGPAGTAVVGVVAQFGDLSRGKVHVRVFNVSHDEHHRSGRWLRLYRGRRQVERR